MGLSYLSKKSWHPSTFKNIEVVWAAEQKKKQEEQRQTEHIKKLKEERQIEELRQLQVMAKVIPESQLQRIDWMYQDRSAQQSGQQEGHTAEEYLLGKSVKEMKDKQDQEDEFKKKIVPVVRGDSYTTTQNEAFLKMMEDPLVMIKSKELEARNAVYDNPLKMKQILKEIEALKKGNKKKSKKDKKKKKDKKHKKDKKKHKKRVRDSDDESSDNSDDDNESSKRSKQSRNRSNGRSESEVSSSTNRRRRHSDSRSSSSSRSDSNISSSSEKTKDKSSRRHSDHVSEKSYQTSKAPSLHNRSRSRSPVQNYRNERRNRDERTNNDRQHRDKDNRDYREKRRGIDSRSKSRSPVNHQSDGRKDRERQEKTGELIKSRSHQEQQISSDKQDLGPDMKIYGEKARLQELNQQLRRKQEPSYDVEKLTPEERERKLQEMMGFAQKHDQKKNIELFGQSKVPLKGKAEDLMREQRERLDKGGSSRDAAFLKDINRKSYMESGISLEDRIGRNKHYIGRDANKE